jgi:glycosyltransferase involved in cell wall biosynthesis
MNNNKICFIYCIKDEVQFTESLHYLQSIHIPDGFELEVLPVTNVKSIASGYNYAMNNSDAKYKVYLHEDILIINKNFINDLLKIFQEKPQLGLLGMVGTNQFPINGVWWETEKNFGKVYDNHTGEMKLSLFQEVKSEYCPVLWIDGFIMATQYDLPWRDDLLKDWDFYELSQSMEFIKAGYEVGVPRQEKPWSIHDCGIYNEKVTEYPSEIILEIEHTISILKSRVNEEEGFLSIKKPKVTVIIPTYNQKQHLKEALESVLIQDYENLEIVVADDCSSDGTQEMMQGYIDNKRVNYIRHPKNLGPGLNTKYILYNRIHSDYIVVLNHDDYYIDSNFISKAAKMLYENQNLSFVWANCKILNMATGKMNDTNHHLAKETEGIDFFLHYETSKSPHITSVLTTMFRMKHAIDRGCFKEESKSLDYFLHLKLMLSGNIGFIEDHVGVYRIHSESMSYNFPKGYDFSTIIELEKLKDYVISLGYAKELLEQWIHNRIFAYFSWRVTVLWRNNDKKSALELLTGISEKYPFVCESVLKCIQ